MTLTYTLGRATDRACCIPRGSLTYHKSRSSQESSSVRRSVVKEGRIFNNLKDEYIFDHPEDGWSLNLRMAGSAKITFSFTSSHVLSLVWHLN